MSPAAENDCPVLGLHEGHTGACEAFAPKSAPIHGQASENAVHMPLQAVQEGSGHVVVGVHGLFSRGAMNTDLLLADLAALGHPVLEFDWGPRPALWSRLFAGRIARRLIAAVEGYSEVHVVAHSFGPAIVRAAMKQGQQFGSCVFFNPALNARCSFPEDRYRHITVVANPYDKVLTLGKRLLGAVGYGDMGRFGYKGRSPRVHTVFGADPNRPGLQDHVSAFADRTNLRKWACYVDDAILTSTQEQK